MTELILCSLPRTRLLPRSNVLHATAQAALVDKPGYPPITLSVFSGDVHRLQEINLGDHFECGLQWHVFDGLVFWKGEPLRGDDGEYIRVKKIHYTPVGIVHTACSIIGGQIREFLKNQ